MFVHSAVAAGPEPMLGVRQAVSKSSLFSGVAVLLATAAMVIGVSQLWKTGRALREVVQRSRGTWVEKDPGFILQAAVQLPPLRVGDLSGLSTDLDLSTGTLLILAFDIQCSVCNSTFPRWVDLLIELEGKPVRIVALTPDIMSNLELQYWRGLARHIEIYSIAPMPSVLEGVLGVPGVPATLVARNGQLTVAYAGPLTPSQTRRILRELNVDRR